MEKEGFSECLLWLQNVCEDSGKDFETFCATFRIEPMAKTNEAPIKVKIKKVKNTSEEDISYVASGDVDSDSYSENEKEYLYMDNFLDDEGIVSDSI